ncbi:MAG TPA: GTPase Era [Chitinophagales bacterium]|nr:GTPase Era [Chitinophagales bacterium]
MQPHKAGFVNIIGLPNVGKSTLLNALTGERLAIISPKAQTTRHRILGILNNEDYQIVFSDTPGFINQPSYKLQSTMNSFVKEAFEDADVLLFVTDNKHKAEDQQHIIDLAKKSGKPVLIILNKIDLYGKKELDELTAYWAAQFEGAEVVPLSAASGINAKKVIRKIVALMPESPAYYSKDEMTDRNMRFFVAEIVREKIFHQYDAEIPYSCQVVVDTYKESDDIDRIKCLIFVERESQKGILIGEGGKALKRLGTEARLDIEKFTGKRAYLELLVKVKDNWRNDDDILKKFGYN